MNVPQYFLNISRRYEFLSKSLEPQMRKARMRTLPDIYAAKAVFFTTIGFVVSLVYVFVMGIFLRIHPIPSIVFSIAAAIFVSALIIAASFLYPRSVAGAKKKSIETNLPFAALHMRALASSGVPPQEIFRMLSESEEYGAVAEESEIVHRNIDMFGMDFITAVRSAAEKTPSDDMRQFLNGIAATMTSGGDLQEYLAIASDRSLLNYKLRREKWLSTLSTYADFYVGVLIAAPLFFVSVLSMLSVIGGDFGGFSITFVMYIGIYAIMPLLNIAFLLFVHYTQPAV